MVFKWRNTAECIGMIQRIKLITLSTFYWNACTNHGKWAVMYFCVRDFSIGCWNCSDGLLFSVFAFRFKWTI